MSAERFWYIYGSYEWWRYNCAVMDAVVRYLEAEKRRSR